jgi:hypothetical protein
MYQAGLCPPVLALTPVLDFKEPPDHEAQEDLRVPLAVATVVEKWAQLDLQEPLVPVVVEKWAQLDLQEPLDRLAILSQAT